ncbi:hypothetical protein ACFVWN_23315 [Nocardiopsis flavescens]|uniref:hypothetical protein n=1 Tax=Nocardiopsis flavescens TaxID=758803 RepID=UPI00364EC549
MLLLPAVAGDSDSPYRDVVAGLTALGRTVRGSDLLGTLRPTPRGILLARAALGAPVGQP